MTNPINLKAGNNDGAKKPELNEVARIVHACLFNDLGLDRMGVAKKMIPELELLIKRAKVEGAIEEIEGIRPDGVPTLSTDFFDHRLTHLKTLLNEKEK